ncbi:MAG: ABC transporter permease [Candidatus Bipolaricaulota bacterium]|nr:ABC transporter permease [Candidatus Bipolaricaulota bacterium]MDW8030631.1 ABC transporter permease [Candidatus Bipolaricaulota bacterium]
MNGRLLWWPGLLWLLLFFAIPVTIIALISLAHRAPDGVIRWGFTLENYLRLVEPLYWAGPFVNSLLLAVLTTGLCLVLGYPVAYSLARQPRAVKNLLLFLVILPFFTNFLVRIYAWFIVLRPEGWLSEALRALGVDLVFLGSPVGVLIGLVYGYLPFMILPLYASLERLDFSLVEAAHDLGATRWQSFWRVIFPLSRSGVIAGSVLVFIPVLGEFITPKLLGGGKVPMFGVLIEEKFLGRVPDWPLGAAMALALMGLVSLVLIRSFRYIKESRWVG